MNRFQEALRTIRLRLGLPNSYAINRLGRLYGRGAGPEVLYLGDSVLERVSRDDRDGRTLDRCVADRLDGLRLAGLGRSAFNPGVFRLIVEALRFLPGRPLLLLLPVNLRCFSPQWDLNPRHQVRDHVLSLASFLRTRGAAPDLRGMDRLPSRGEFRDLAVEDSTAGEMERWARLVPRTEAETAQRRARLFRYHYMVPVTEDNRQRLHLEAILPSARAAGIRVAAYLTPINREAGVQWAGPGFLERVAANVAAVLPAVREADWFRDLSGLLPDDCFFHPDSPTEHLNAPGRIRLATILAEGVMQTLAGNVSR